MENEEDRTSGLIQVAVDIVDLFDYAADSRRNWKEGNEIFKNNHVLMVGVTKRDGDHMNIFGSCLRGSNPAEPPRQIDIVTSTRFQDWKILCSCPAGQHKCKHQFACLLYIHNKKELDVITPTELRQQWGKVAKSQSSAMYEPVKLTQLCGQQAYNRQKFKIDLQMYENILDVLKTELPESALSKAIIGRNLRPRSETVDTPLQVDNSIQDLQPELPRWNPRDQRKDLVDPYNVPCRIELIESYIRSLNSTPLHFCGPLSTSEQYVFFQSKVLVTLEDCIEIAISTTDNSMERWRNERRVRITASVCYDLFTFYKNDKGSRDWTKKLSSIIHPLEMRLPALAYGKRMESSALNCYQRKNPDKIISRMGLFVPPGAPFLGCTPDAVVLSEKKLIEIKCPVAGGDRNMEEMIKSLKYVQNINGILALREKHSYYGQVQLGMHLLNLDSTDFVIFNGKEDDYVCLNVQYDGRFVEELLQILKDVYFNVMLPALTEQ